MKKSNQPLTKEELSKLDIATLLKMHKLTEEICSLEVYPFEKQKRLRELDFIKNALMNKGFK